MRTLLSLHRYGRHRARRYAQLASELRMSVQRQALRLAVFLERLSRFLGQPRLSPT
jgi:hypothetical protein